MKARYYLFGCLALAACDSLQMEEAEPVVVYFAQPFPANVPDLPGFLPRDCRQYTALGDTTRIFGISEKVLTVSYFETMDVRGALLDSAKLPRRASSGLGPGGLRYRVQALAADSFRLRAEARDTVLNLAGRRPTRLRRYQGVYYISTPAYLDSTKWVVQRLTLADGHLLRQIFNPDSLRVRALEPGTVQQRRAKGQVLLTLAPQSRRAIGQVGSYAGLWLAAPTYGPTLAETQPE
ncbi:MAG: hypothetical protein ACRYG7_37760 [Janthinobacterium lividum]